MNQSPHQRPQPSNRQLISRISGAVLFLSMITLAGLNLNSQQKVPAPVEKAMLDTQQLDWSHLPQEKSAIEWGAYSTDLDGNIGRLSWRTNRERNPQYFVIERAFNKQDFTTIGTIWNRAKGEQEGKAYEFLDLSLDESEMPWVFYLIKQIGTDHHVHFSDTLSVRRHEQIGFFIDLSLLTTGDLFVRFAADHSMEGLLLVTSQHGQVLHQEEISTHFLPQSRMLDIQSWPAGSYTISLTNERYGKEKAWKIN
ncbi:MAG: hypothetical protein AAFR61_12475 [Bacteroidota bacterium]